MKAVKLFLGVLFIVAMTNIYATNDNSKANYSKGLELMNAGKYTEAIVYFSKAIEEKNDLAPAYYYRAYCYCQLKNPEAACPDLEKAASLGHNVEKVGKPCGCEVQDPK